MSVENFVSNLPGCIAGLKILESCCHVDRSTANHMTVGQNYSLFGVNNESGCRADSLIGLYKISHIGDLQ